MLLIRAVIAFLLLPAVFAGLLPWYLSHWDPWAGTGFDTGLLPLVVGLSILLSCVRDFYVSGKGTLAPWSPPEKMVTVGLYRYSRNPMYIGVLLIIAGWAIISASPLTLLYLFVAAGIFHLRVRLYEEKWLAAQFDRQWQDYAAAVPCWLPDVSMLLGKLMRAGK